MYYEVLAVDVFANFVLQQENSVAPFPVASLSLYGNNPEAHLNGKLHESSTAKQDLSFPFDHIVLPSEIEVQVHLLRNFLSDLVPVLLEGYLINTFTPD